MSLIVPLGPDPSLSAPPSAKEDIRRIAGDGGDSTDAVRECYRQYYEKKELQEEQEKDDTAEAEKGSRRTSKQAGEKPTSVHVHEESSEEPQNQSLASRVASRVTHFFTDI